MKFPTVSSVETCQTCDGFTRHLVIFSSDERIFTGMRAGSGPDVVGLCLFALVVCFLVVFLRVFGSGWILWFACEFL